MGNGHSRAAVMALDVGTSSTRAMLFDSDASPVEGAEIHRKYDRTLKADGTAECDAEYLLEVVLATIDELLQTEVARAVEIAAVGISTFWHGLVGASAEGRATTPLFLWSDSRSWREAESLVEHVDAEAVRQRTGCAIHPTFWPAKLQWLRLEQPDRWKATSHWLSLGDLLLWRLFGRPLTSISLASGTGLFTLRGLDWDRELLSATEVDESALPALEDEVRGLKPEYAHRWPQLAQLPWKVARGDGALASVGSGCVDAKVRAITVGTSGALRVMDANVPDRLPDGLFCYRLDASVVVAGAASSNGGNVHEWLLKTLAVGGDDLDQQVAAMRPGAHGLAFLPLFAGERSLGFAPLATGAIAGLTLATTPAEIVRAGLESIAIEFARYDARINEGWRRATRLVASGAGLLKSPAWMQMMADAIGVEVVASRAAEASARGAAAVALEAVGLWNPRNYDPGSTLAFQPNAGVRELYLHEMERQEALYDVVVRRRLLARDARSAHFIFD